MTKKIIKHAYQKQNKYNMYYNICFFRYLVAIVLCMVSVERMTLEERHVHIMAQQKLQMMNMRWRFYEKFAQMSYKVDTVMCFLKLTSYQINAKFILKSGLIIYGPQIIKLNFEIFFAYLNNILFQLKENFIIKR